LTINPSFPPLSRARDMDNPRGGDEERLARMVDSLLYSNAEEGVDVVFSFDTTGARWARRCP
jgi:hypothetical protein